MSPDDFNNATMAGSSSVVVTSAGAVLAADDDGADGSVPWGLFGSPPGRHDWDGSLSVSRPGYNDTDGPSLYNAGGPGGMYDGPITAEQLHMSSVANEWLSYVLMIVGWFLVLGGMLNYWRAVRPVVSCVPSRSVASADDDFGWNRYDGQERCAGKQQPAEPRHRLPSPRSRLPAL